MCHSGQYCPIYCSGCAPPGKSPQAVARLPKSQVARRAPGVSLGLSGAVLLAASFAVVIAIVCALAGFLPVAPRFAAGRGVTATIIVALVEDCVRSPCPADRCLQRPRTVPLPAKLLRSRVYKPGPWLWSRGRSQMASVCSENASLQLPAAPLPQAAPRCSAAFRCGGGLGPAEIGGPNPSGSVASSTARAR